MWTGRVFRPTHVILFYLPVLHGQHRCSVVAVACPGPSQNHCTRSAAGQVTVTDELKVT